MANRNQFGPNLAQIIRGAKKHKATKATKTPRGGVSDTYAYINEDDQDTLSRQRNHNMDQNPMTNLVNIPIDEADEPVAQRQETRTPQPLQESGSIQTSLTTVYPWKSLDRFKHQYPLKDGVGGLQVHMEQGTIFFTRGRDAHHGFSGFWNATKDDVYQGAWGHDHKAQTNYKMAEKWGWCGQVQEPSVRTFNTDGDVQSVQGTLASLDATSSGLASTSSSLHTPADVIKEFTRDELKDAEAVAEAAYLAPALERDDFQRLIRKFCERIDQPGPLDYHQLEGLAQVIRSFSGYLEENDDVSVLKLLDTRLKDTHQQSTIALFR
ncbi:MAG: hypothetical protein J3Q66DRAFT_422451 [Benniella sp.]|nr:MAG: hypothetical protein J3Q66DRAFT_422451 [Benniella sp.]